MDVRGQDATGASLTNSAEVKGKDSLDNEVKDDDDHTVDLIDPEITVSKTGPAFAYSGSDISFTVTANNSGDDPITNVVITDTPCDPALNNTPTSGDAGTDGIMGVGETWSWTCVIKNATGATKTNTAEVKGKDSLNNEVKDDDDHTVDLIDPEITVSKTGPAFAYSGSDISFTVTANNSGDDPITNVVITDAPCDPALSNTPDSGDAGTDGIMGVGETWSWTCVIKNATGATKTNTAEVKGKDSLNNEVKDDDDHTVDLIDPEITVTKTGPATAYAGSNVSFPISAENTGDDPITNVTISDTKTCDPALSNTPTSGDTGNDGIMGVGETWNWTCVVKNATGASLTNSAEVKGKDSLDNEVKDDDPHTVDLIDPEITVSKTGPAFAYSGSDISFTVTANNSGDDPITNVVITDTPCDPALSNTPTSGDAGTDGIMGVGETWSWTCVIKNATGSSKTNTAEVKGKDSLNNEVKDDDDHVVDLIDPEITVSKTGPATAYSGSDVSFTVTANNSGDDPITNVVITDTPCDPALSNTPTSGDAGTDGIMGVGETWSWTCVIKNATGVHEDEHGRGQGQGLAEQRGQGRRRPRRRPDRPRDHGEQDRSRHGLRRQRRVVHRHGEQQRRRSDHERGHHGHPVRPGALQHARLGRCGRRRRHGRRRDVELDVCHQERDRRHADQHRRGQGQGLAEQRGHDDRRPRRRSHRPRDHREQDRAGVRLLRQRRLVHRHRRTTAATTRSRTSRSATRRPCDPALSNTPASGDAGSDGIMGVGETWTWTCVVKNATGASKTNSAEVKGKDSLNNEVKDDDDHVVDLIDPEITVSKTGPATAYQGSDVTFTITANNSGDDPITNVTISDTKTCDPALSNTPASGDAGSDGIMGVGETWTWTCVVKNVTGASLTNSAEVKGKDSLNNEVKDDDDHTVRLIARRSRSRRAARRWPTWVTT